MKPERFDDKHDTSGPNRGPSFTPLKRIFDRIQRRLRWKGSDVQKPIELKVHFAKDDETGRWFIASSDIPGLRVEADTADELIRKVEEVAPDLIELNCEEILSRHVRRSPAPSRQPKSPKPSMSIRPVFDSPMAVACI